jgi:hypothetical protein
MLKFLAPPPFSGALSAVRPPPLCARLQFGFVYVFGGQVSLSGVVLAYPRGGWGSSACCWHSPVWSVECLRDRFGASGVAAAAAAHTSCDKFCLSCLINHHMSSFGFGVSPRVSCVKCSTHQAVVCRDETTEDD